MTVVEMLDAAAQTAMCAHASKGRTSLIFDRRRREKEPLANPILALDGVSAHERDAWRNVVLHMMNLASSPSLQPLIEYARKQAAEVGASE